MTYDEKKEFEWAGVVKRGDRDAGGRGSVWRAQEWLRVAGYKIVVDGDFGGGTETAMLAFQRERGIEATGVCGEADFAELTRKVRLAFEPIAQLPADVTLGRLTAAYARRFAEASAKEIPPNGGPCVRLFMNGHEGKIWAWCSGFVWRCMRLAQAQLGVASLPFAMSTGVLRTTENAMAAGRFVEGKKADPARLAGALFVVPKPGSHIGCVEAVQGNFVGTIEGNTNLQGAREGTDVLARTRSLRGLNYLLIDPAR